MSEEQTTIDVREKIIDSARRLFVQNGFNGTSVRDIAADSETNVAMVNYYFRSKYNLFTDIFEEAFTTVAGKVFTLLEADLPFFEMIRGWIYAYYDVLNKYPGFPLFILNEMSQHPEALKERLDLSLPNSLYIKIQARLQEEMEQGVIPETNVLDFLMNVISLCLFPFVFAPVANTFLNVGKEEYNEFLEGHKVYVADFVIKALKK